LLTIRFFNGLMLLFRTCFVKFKLQLQLFLCVLRLNQHSSHVPNLLLEHVDLVGCCTGPPICIRSHEVGLLAGFPRLSLPALLAESHCFQRVPLLLEGLVGVDGRLRCLAAAEIVVVHSV
jgi:hypothetical protein